MDSYERIAQEFHRRIDSIAGAVDDLAPGIEAASQAITKSVLADHKILVIGAAGAAPLATQIAHKLSSTSAAGPALPAIAVVTDADASTDQAYWQRLRTLTRDGDVLLCLDVREDAFVARYCLEFARQRNLLAVTLSEKNVELQNAITLQLKAPDESLRGELLVMTSHCLAAQIHQLMLGE